MTAGGGRRPRRADGTAVSTHQDIERALAALRSCRSSLLSARGYAAMAAVRLYGARAARASELGELLADALAFCERLAFIVEGDLRSDV